MPPVNSKRVPDVSLISKAVFTHPRIATAELPPKYS